MTTYFRMITLAAIVVALFPISSLAQGLTPVRFCLDWAMQAHHAQWGLAIKKQYFEANGLEVTMDRGYGSGDTIVKVASGAYDIGFMDINALIKFNAENPDRRLIAFYQVFYRTPNSIVALAKSGIRTPADLVGKTLGAPDGDSSRLMFGTFARANTIDPATVNWISMAPTLRETMLVQGQVDAISGFSSTAVFNLIALGVPKEDIVVIGYADHGLDLYGSALAATPDYIAKHPDVIAAFVEATIAGTIDLMKDPDAGMQAMKEIEPLFDTKLERDRLAFLMDKGMMKSPALETDGLGYVDRSRMERTVKANSEAYNIPAPPLEEIYTTEFLPPLAQRLPPN
ncbi:ABC transporter substrate-binding protein [Rhizobium sp. BK251]|uniref:ABC transporter substrate-binding protein n=1 Tax=Rhizobium sp. BK251 TaxID=2512125 RepID=UPI001053405D|nr:ABC transporter substrate-binding protein [Rhizobium sp. BK251]TCL68080.1 NitT/TauT family transport system substrate-binding protein [Rhizobium sp. BK251]